MRPLCVKCQVEYRPEKNDVTVEEMTSFGSYRLWSADLWECPSCHNQMIVGYGNSAYAEHWMDSYKRALVSAEAFGVYKCFEFKDDPIIESEREREPVAVNGFAVETNTVDPSVEIKSIRFMGGQPS